MPDSLPLQKILDLIRWYAGHEFPGEVPERLTIRFRSGRKWRFDLAGNQPEAPPLGPAEEFEPTDFQIDILAALEGRALRTDDLAAAVDCDRRKLFRPHGIKELVEHGLAAHSEKHGYYRPDCAPDALKGT